MEKYYFLRTLVEEGRQRCKALIGQTFEDGAKVDSTVNVSADRALRDAYPTGTTFVTDSLRAASKYYQAGNIYPIGILDSDYRDPKHRPTEEMLRAYEIFIGATDLSDSVSPKEKESSKTTSKSLLGKMKLNPELKIPSIGSEGFYVDSDVWYLLMRNIQNQVNTMLIGATGGGKTELVLLACKKLGISCSVYDMGSMYDPVAGLLGVHRLQKGGVSVFDYAKFTRDISKPGVVLLDELSRAPVTTNNILFPCLDSRRKLPVEIAGGEDLREIEVHPECCFIATANVGVEYTGTMSMDRALVGRFFPIELSYMPPEQENKVLVKRCGISISDATNIVKVANSLRNMYNKQEISSSISTRETLMVGDLVADGWDLVRAMELVLLPLFEGTRSDGERGIVCRVISSR
jgi:MoxR-like ATPase|nr:MAG: hydrolytic ATP binding site of dynein motor region [Bacteriophage sp.]UVY04382.1 MAG: Hydrolytic ATP binding site of dynein motor region [Bacteriophage sp.]UVY15580.1 MAG: Hydrolytic ATP binding site of dynein motor region [Bacteriophage sp.]